MNKQTNRGTPWGPRGPKKRFNKTSKVVNARSSLSEGAVARGLVTLSRGQATPRGTSTQITAKHLIWLSIQCSVDLDLQKYSRAHFSRIDCFVCFSCSSYFQFDGFMSKLTMIEDCCPERFTLFVLDCLWVEGTTCLLVFFCNTIAIQRQRHCHRPLTLYPQAQIASGN